MSDMCAMAAAAASRASLLRQAAGGHRTALPQVTIVFTTLAGWDRMKVGSAGLTT